MSPSHRTRLAGAILLISFVAAFGVGCKKQRAGLNLKKLNDIVNEATVHEGAEYSAQEYNNVKTTLDNAQKAFDAQNWTQAFNDSRAGLTAGETMLENVKQKRAADRQNIAGKDIRVAEDNQGPSEDPQRYDRIIELRDTGAKAYSKSKWDEAIDNYLKVSEEVDNLLRRMKTDAEDRLIDIKAQVEKMEAEGVRIHAENLGLVVDGQVAAAETAIVEERQYREAQTIMNGAEQSIGEAITEAKRVRSQIIINVIENDLIVAMSKGAPVYYRERFEGAAELYENVLRDFGLKNFDLCLQAADMLEERVKSLKYDTRKKSAEVRVKSLETDIATLEEGGAREYLVGMVEILDAMLEDAKQELSLLTEDAFERAEDICEAASAEHKKILADFNELANDAIAEANKELNIATEVFQATERIFDLEIPGPMTSLQQQLEDSKQMNKEMLRGLIDAASAKLGTAQLKRDGVKYRDAILLAEQVQSTAKTIQEETYRVAAHNAILEIQAQLTYLQTAQAAGLYAPRAVELTQKLVDGARKTLERKEMKDAVDAAAEAKAQLEVLRQELGGKGAQTLAEAKAAIEKAIEDGASEYADVPLEEARANLEKALAMGDSAEVNYKDIIESSAAALAAAKKAKEQANRRYSEVQLELADSKMQRAAQSHAELYASRVYKDAQDKFKAAQAMLDAKNYKEASRLAEASGQLSDEAAYERVILAENEIANGRNFNAWTYSPQRFAQAINAAKDARRMADQGEFDLARLHADSSALLAKQAADEAKRLDVSNRLEALSAGVQEGIKSGASNFQGAEVKQLIDQIVALEGSFEPGKYEAADEKLTEMEARLEEVLVSTPAVLERSVSQLEALRKAYMESRVDIDIFAGQQMEDSEKLLRYARLDFEKGKYHTSYTNLRKAMKILQEVGQILASSKYNETISGLFDDFIAAQEDFRDVLTLNKTMMIQLSINTADGNPQAVILTGEQAPLKFRETIENLYRQALAIEPPKLKKNTHQSVVDLFTMARLSSMNFEKLLILDQYDRKTARDIISTAYDQIAAARQQQQLIEKTFREPGSDSRIVGTRKAIGLALY